MIQTIDLMMLSNNQVTNDTVLLIDSTNGYSTNKKYQLTNSNVINDNLSKTLPNGNLRCYFTASNGFKRL